MDPDKNLEEQLELSRELLALVDLDAASIHNEILDKAEQLADRVKSLDEWIRKGGTLPKRWQCITPA